MVDQYYCTEKCNCVTVKREEWTARGFNLAGNNFTGTFSTIEQCIDHNYVDTDVYEFMKYMENSYDCSGKIINYLCMLIGIC